MNKVDTLFENKGFCMNNIYVYKKDIAIEYVVECKKNHIIILGIDAFIIMPNFHQPDMYNSIDFTAKNNLGYNKEDVWDNAISFLRTRDDIYYFEIVT